MHTLTSTCYREESFDFQFFIGFITIYFAFTFISLQVNYNVSFFSMYIKYRNIIHSVSVFAII